MFTVGDREGESRNLPLALRDEFVAAGDLGTAGRFQVVVCPDEIGDGDEAIDAFLAKAARASRPSQPTAPCSR